MQNAEIFSLRSMSNRKACRMLRLLNAVCKELPEVSGQQCAATNPLICYLSVLLLSALLCVKRLLLQILLKVEGRNCSKALLSKSAYCPKFLSAVCLKLQKAIFSVTQCKVENSRPMRQRLLTALTSLTQCIQYCRKP